MITADALHCQRETAEHIVGRGGHYILTVKGNQPNLRRQLRTLPWKQIPVLSRTTEHGHGRHEIRSLKATEISDGLLFPHAVQVLQLTRTTRRSRNGKRHTEVVYAVTSLAAVDSEDEVLAGRVRAVTGRRRAPAPAVGRSLRGRVAGMGAGRALDGDDVVDAPLGQRQPEGGGVAVAGVRDHNRRDPAPLGEIPPVLRRPFYLAPTSSGSMISASCPSGRS